MNQPSATQFTRTLAMFRLIAGLVCLVIGTSALASPGEKFSTLRSAPTHTDLPIGQETNTLSMGSNRSFPTYPQLRLDKRDIRTPQATPPKPAAPPSFVLQAQPAPKPAPKPVDSDAMLSNFQIMARQTIGTVLPIYGRDLFSKNKREFDPIDQVNVPADYVLGPGDELYLRAWGSVDIDYHAIIDRAGTISIPKVGEIPLSGVRFGDVRQHIRGVISRSFHGFELSVSMGQLRSIRVYVTGFAAAPGTYTLNALSTPVNALFYAGGPAIAGDLRHIEIQRAGQRVAKVDLYAFLQRGVHDSSFRLMPEDVIHVPSVHAEAAIAGAVHRPGIYRMRRSETLKDLIDFAGGLGTAAATHRVVIERIGVNRERLVEEFTLDQLGKNVDIRNGDIVLIQPISPQFENAITLRGHVAQPLRHKWKSGLRIADLLPTTEALVSPSYWITKYSNNTVVRLLKNGPKVKIDKDFPDINWEYAVIERIDPDSLSTQLVPFHLHKAINMRDPEHNLELQPGDQITVFALRDFRTRKAQRAHFVKVEGEVERAGFYEVSPDETLEDVVARAGGLTRHAYLFGIELKRESVRRQQKLRIGESIDQLEQEYQRHLIDRSRNVLTGDMTLAINPEAHAIDRLISRLREAEPSGRIVMELSADIRTTHQLPTLKLNDGDQIFVPPIPATIEVVGAVYRQGSFIYNHTAPRDYIANAGLLPTADKRRIYVVRPDGSFSLADRRFRIKPGDTIIVPEKVDRQRMVRRVKDWTQVLYQFGLGAAGLNLLEVF
ncbi:MAG: SLBB domain-containing protein [Pseudomonadota bacterium]